MMTRDALAVWDALPRLRATGSRKARAPLTVTDRAGQHFPHASDRRPAGEPSVVLAGEARTYSQEKGGSGNFPIQHNLVAGSAGFCRACRQAALQSRYARRRPARTQECGENRRARHSPLVAAWSLHRTTTTTTEANLPRAWRNGGALHAGRRRPGCSLPHEPGAFCRRRGRARPGAGSRPPGNRRLPRRCQRFELQTRFSQGIRPGLTRKHSPVTGPPRAVAHARHWQHARQAVILRGTCCSISRSAGPEAHRDPRCRVPNRLPLPRRG